MNTYNHDRLCPKCGQGGISNRFYMKGEGYRNRTFAELTKPTEYAPEDIIQRLCSNCFFRWNERPLDVEYPVEKSVDEPYIRTLDQETPIFKVGDRVEVITDLHLGDIGIVKGNSSAIRHLQPNTIAVEFDENHCVYHSCEGLCKEGHGYWFNPSDLKHLNEKEVEK